jgi:hypothetical protein
MKRRNREINIFNMSLLDVVVGAMGAFMTIMIVLIPSYRKQNQQQSPAQTNPPSSELVRALQNEQAHVITLEQENTALRAQAAHFADQLKRTFLLVHIQWATVRPDIDLHVFDPEGKEFFWNNRTNPGTSGDLSVDSIYGPGNEVFTDSNARPGVYKVYANYFASHGGEPSVDVKGLIMFKDGTLQLPEVAVVQGGSMILMANVLVADDGAVSIIRN